MLEARKVTNGYKLDIIAKWDNNNIKECLQKQSIAYKNYLEDKEEQEKQKEIPEERSLFAKIIAFLRTITKSKEELE